MHRQYQFATTATLARILSLSMLVLTVSSAYPEVLTVDDDGKADFASIQAAVDFASGGDEILVAPGVYTSDHPLHVVDLLGKEITLRASGGPDMTSIDGEDAVKALRQLNDQFEQLAIIERSRDHEATVVPPH